MNIWMKILVIVVMGAAVGACAAIAGDMMGLEAPLLGGVAGGVTAALAAVLFGKKRAA